MSMMKVAIHYSDGHYDLYDPSTRLFRHGMTDAEKKEWIEKNTIEIHEDDFHEYNEMMETYVRWQRWIVGLSNQIDARNHPQDWVPQD